jgi:hypothetical protein
MCVERNLFRNGVYRGLKFPVDGVYPIAHPDFKSCHIVPILYMIYNLFRSFHITALQLSYELKFELHQFLRRAIYRLAVTHALVKKR